MLGTRLGQTEKVTCIACGQSVERQAAREYDKEGDRWRRENKEFEYLCLSCYSDLDHQPRDELEGILIEIERSQYDLSRTEYLRQYNRIVQERYGSCENER